MAKRSYEIKDSQRRGPWSQKEKEFMLKQSNLMTPEEIASKLLRNEKRVRKYMEQQGYLKNYGVANTTDSPYIYLTKTPYWKNLQKQFNTEELSTFQYHWENVSRQFNDDILHTEEMQIIDMIKFEIMMNRALEKETSITSEIQELNNLLEKERLLKQDKDLDIIKHYSIQIDSLYKTCSVIQKEYTDLHTAKNKIFSALKATREQRIKQIENSKESFIDWVKELMKNPEKRKEYGVYMEKHRLATEVEYARLAELHTYEDMDVDHPILNSSTVI